MNASPEFLHAQQRGRVDTVSTLDGLVHRHALGWHREDWSDFELRFRISGRIIVKKNNTQVIWLGPRASIGYTAEYKAWEKRAAAEIAEQWKSIFPFATPYPLQDRTRLNLRVVTYFEDKRGIPDLCATYEGVQDVLEAHKPRCDLKKCHRHAGVIANDKFVCSHIGSDRLLDPDDPHTELTLTPHRRTP